MAGDGPMRRAGRPSWVDDELYPFQSHFVEVDGHTVHYIDEGSGPILLMLHGNPTWSFVYRQVVALLRGSFRCVAIDYPGFGLSVARAGYGFHPIEQSQVVAEFIKLLGLRDVTLVVQDWGGPIGFGAALQDPGRNRPPGDREHVGVAGERRSVFRDVLPLHGRAACPGFDPTSQLLCQLHDPGRPSSPQVIQARNGALSTTFGDTCQEKSDWYFSAGHPWPHASFSPTLSAA
jgi:pimeloyl-ACP methyl ester carboxylesterase